MKRKASTPATTPVKHPLLDINQHQLLVMSTMQNQLIEIQETLAQIAKLLNTSHKPTVMAAPQAAPAKTGKWKVDKSHPGALKPWTAEDDNLLASLSNRGTPYAEIGKIVGRSIPSVNSRIRLLRKQGRI